MASSAIVFVLVLVSVLASPLPEENDGNNSRIIGGSPAREGQYPHQISLRTNGKHICGGSIIGPQDILTSADCLEGVPLNTLTVIAGTNSLKSGGDSYTVARAIPHENFNKKTLVFDIAVLKLTSTIEFSDNVKVIELADAPTEPETLCIFSGWGLTKNIGIGNKPANNLQHIRSLISISNAECRRAWEGKGNPIHEFHQCTTAPKGEGACKGDFGGPLITGGKQIGIASFVRPCAKGYPDVFTAVDYFRAWIKEKSGV